MQRLDCQSAEQTCKCHLNSLQLGTGRRNFPLTGRFIESNKALVSRNNAGVITWARNATRQTRRARCNDAACIVLHWKIRTKFLNRPFTLSYENAYVLHKSDSHKAKIQSN